MELNRFTEFTVRCTSISYLKSLLVEMCQVKVNQTTYIHDPNSYVPQDFWDDAEDTALLPFSDGPCCGECLEGPGEFVTNMKLMQLKTRVCSSGKSLVPSV